MYKLKVLCNSTPQKYLFSRVWCIFCHFPPKKLSYTLRYKITLDFDILLQLVFLCIEKCVRYLPCQIIKPYFILLTTIYYSLLQCSLRNIWQWICLYMYVCVIWTHKYIHIHTGIYISLYISISISIYNIYTFLLQFLQTILLKTELLRQRVCLQFGYFCQTVF